MGAPRIRRRRLFAGTAAALALSGGAALALEDARQTSSYTLTETRPGQSTGERFEFDYVNPADPEAKPPAVRRVVTILPRGARYDTSAPGSCTADDAQLIARGAAACPPDSAIGGGVVTVDTGLPGPARFITADVEFFNNAEDRDGEFIYVNTVRGSGTRTVIRADVDGRRTVTDVDMLPGTPPDGGAVDTVDVHVDEVTRKGGGKPRRYITTPRRCPRSGEWIARVAFSYGDGVTQTMATANPCKRRARKQVIK